MLAAESGLVPIPKDQLEYGCGCGYRMNETEPYLTVFQSELHFEDPKAFIDGKLVKLEPVLVAQIPSDPKVGDKFKQQYRYQDIILTFVNTITFVCPKGTEGGCEVTNFESILEKSQNGHTDKTHLYGDCGC